ncbi:MAG: ornithine cyclodeaminase family protein [Terriglobales bacterium]
MIQFLDQAEVARRLAAHPAALLEVMAQALMDLSAGRARAPARIAAHSPEGLLAAMPGFVPASTARASGVLGAKLVTVFPANAARGLPGHQALIALFDGSTGAPLAVLDGEMLTAARTAAVSAVATRTLARPDARILAVLGTGVQARAHLQALPLVRPFTEIRIAGRSSERATALAQSTPAATPATSFEAAVRGADVVCCCTHAPEPILHRPWLSPGAHVNSVGIGGCELDRETLQSGLLAVESLTAFSPFPAGAFELQGLDPTLGVELGAVLAHHSPGRTSPTQITVFKSVGHAVEDVAAAHWLCTLAP